MKVVSLDNASATQTEHPWRATLRTFVQSLLGAVLTLVGVLVFTPGAMDELVKALNGVGVVVPAAIVALPPVIARIMAIPGVEKALRSVSLGAAPSEVVFGDWSGQPDGAVVDDVSQLPDPSVDDSPTV